MQHKRAIAMTVLAATYVFGATTQANTYLVFGSVTERFKGVNELRANGHTVHMLYMDVTKSTMKRLNGFGNLPDTITNEQKQAIADEVESKLDTQLLGKSLTNDLAVNKLAKNLGLKKFPAILDYRKLGKSRIVYGQPNLIEASRTLADWNNRKL